MKNVYYLFFLFAFVFSCEEKLPLRVAPPDVAEPVFSLTSDFAINVLPYESEASNGILFKVGIKNIFDETFDDKPFVDGHIKIWQEPDRFVRQLDFHSEDNNNLTVDIGESAWIDVYWDQKDEAGEPIWNLPERKSKVFEPLNFKAAARIKFYRNIPYYQTDTVSFTVQYDTSTNISNVNFLAVDMLDFAHAWISGTDGTIYYLYFTEEWVNYTAKFSVVSKLIRQESGTSVDLNDLEFFNYLTGLCVGDSGTILLSNNGGENWEQKTVPFTDNLNKLSFISEMKGWIVGDNGLIITTNDGGETWIRQQSNTDVNLYGVYFSSVYSGLAVGELGTVLTTDDCGKTWTILRNKYTNCFKDVYFDPFDRKWIIAGTEGFLKGFNSYASQWTDYLVNTSIGLNRIFYLNIYRSWGVGNKGCIVSQVPGKKQWVVQSTLSKNCLHDISFTDRLMGVAVGDGETIFYTGNGDHWLCVRNFKYHWTKNDRLVQWPRFKVILNNEKGSIKKTNSTELKLHEEIH